MAKLHALDTSLTPKGVFRYVHVGIAMFQCLTTAGIVFGWVSLVPILQRDGIYSEYCSDEETNCHAQSIRLHFAFTIAASSNMVANLFLGIVFDRYGPRACKVLSLACVATGSILVAYARERKSNPGVDLFLPGLSIVAFGGTGIQLGSIHLSNLFPNFKSAVTCLIVGAFQMSFIVFMIFNEIYTNYGISRKDIFVTFTFLVLLNMFLSWIFNPDTPYQLENSSLPPEQETKDYSIRKHSGAIRLPSVFKKEGDNILKGTPRPSNHEYSKSIKENDRLLPGRNDRDLKHRSFRTQVISSPFLHLVLHFSVGTLWCNYFLGSLHAQLSSKDILSEKLKFYMTCFNVILPGGAVLIPFIGVFIEKFGFYASFLTNSLFALIYTVLIQFDSSIPILASFVLYSVFRTALFALIFAYLGFIFGFKHFGVLSGVLFAIAAVFDLLQTPITQIHNFTIVGVIQFFTYLLIFSLPLYEKYINTYQR